MAERPPQSLRDSSPWEGEQSVRRDDSVGSARVLRQSMTEEELILWSQLRRRQLGGFKFRRQHPIGPYVADFACLEAKLRVELDGGQHSEQRDADKIRDENIAEHGFKVLRVWNRDVRQNLSGVLDQILQTLEERNGLTR